jgi:hypothetical protein
VKTFSINGLASSLVATELYETVTLRNFKLRGKEYELRWIEGILSVLISENAQVK